MAICCNMKASNNMEAFEERIKRVLGECNIHIKYNIVATKNNYNILYVEKREGQFFFYANIDEIHKRGIDIDICIYHEIYHVKQYIEDFPMIVSNNGRFAIVQKIITDLYVTKELIKDNKYDKAYKLFKYRIKNLHSINIHSIEDIHRMAYVLLESKHIFKHNLMIESMDNHIPKSVTKIYKILRNNYFKDDILTMYEQLINNIDETQAVMIFENKIIL